MQYYVCIIYAYVYGFQTASSGWASWKRQGFWKLSSLTLVNFQQLFRIWRHRASKSKIMLSSPRKILPIRKIEQHDQKRHSHFSELEFLAYSLSAIAEAAIAKKMARTAIFVYICKNVIVSSVDRICVQAHRFQESYRHAFSRTRLSFFCDYCKSVYGTMAPFLPYLVGTPTASTVV